MIIFKYFDKLHFFAKALWQLVHWNSFLSSWILIWLFNLSLFGNRRLHFPHWNIKYHFFKIQISSEFFWPNPKGPIPSQYLKLTELTFSSPIIAIQNPMPNLGQGQVQQMKRRFSAKILILQYLVPCFSLGSWTHRDNFCNCLFLFLTEEAWSHGGLRTRKLGHTPSHVK